MIFRILISALIGLLLRVLGPVVLGALSGDPNMNAAGWYWFLTAPLGLMGGIILGAISSRFD